MDPTIRIILGRPEDSSIDRMAALRRRGGRSPTTRAAISICRARFTGNGGDVCIRHARQPLDLFPDLLQVHPLAADFDDVVRPPAQCEPILPGLGNAIRRHEETLRSRGRSGETNAERTQRWSEKILQSMQVNGSQEP